MNAREQIQRAKQALGIFKDKDLAKIIGVKQSTVGVWINRNKITDEGYLAMKNAGIDIVTLQTSQERLQEITPKEEAKTCSCNFRISELERQIAEKNGVIEFLRKERDVAVARVMQLERACGDLDEKKCEGNGITDRHVSFPPLLV